LGKHAFDHRSFPQHIDGDDYARGANPQAPNNLSQNAQSPQWRAL
jgi:hypothetical protein